MNDIKLEPIHIDKWNVLFHWPHIYQVLRHHILGTTKAPMPITVEVNPIDFCNHDCTWCFTATHRKKDRMTQQVLTELIQDLGKGGTKSIHFAGGGESTAFKNLVKRRSNLNYQSSSTLHQAKKLGLTVGMISNGSLLKLLDPNELINDLSWIRFSIDAGTEERYQLIHKPNKHSLADVHESIKELVKLRGKNSSPSIGASFIVDSNTIEVKNEILEFCSTMAFIGVDYVQIKPENSNRGIESNIFLRGLHKDIEKVFLEFSTFAMMNAPYISNDNSDFCWYSYLGPVVGATGDTYVCCYTYGQDDFKYGQINEKKSYKDIWNDSARRDLVDGIIPRNCPSCRHSTANIIIERLSQLSEESWLEFDNLWNKIRSGISVSEIDIPTELEWLSDGLSQIELVVKRGLNGMLDYPTYRSSLFIGLN